MKKLILYLLLCMISLGAAAQAVNGDVNGDGNVNISDVNAIISIVLDGHGVNTEADLNGDGTVNISDVNAIISIILDGPSSQAKDYVDLGLPSGMLWATRNVGATSPEDSGDYFAWGEIKPKSEFYSWDNYQWGWYDSYEDRRYLWKYNTNSYYGKVDNRTELELIDDAAFTNYPSGRMPSKKQFRELIKSCTWQWTQKNGVNGYQVTGPNGNSLFLPAVGETNWPSKTIGFYWTRELDENNPCTFANSLEFTAGGGQLFVPIDRPNGLSVRAVRFALYIEQDSLDLGTAPIGETLTAELTIVNTINEALTVTVAADGPFALKQEDGSASNMTVVVPGHSSVPVTVMFSPVTTGQFNGNVTFLNPALDGGQSVVAVHACAIPSDYADRDFVDLGLPSGTLWATRNVGASSPEESGSHFAWGETQPKEFYELSTYKWCNGNADSFTKYCTMSDCGTVDNLTELEAEDDAATVNWGTSWCMPSQDQITELKENCTHVWTSLHGVNGQLFTGPNGNSLFLPAAGIRIENLMGNVGNGGYYWTRELNARSTLRSYVLYFGSDFVRTDVWNRQYGLSVRPVHVPQN